VGVVRNVHTSGRPNPLACIQRRSTRDMSQRFTTCAIREYGNGSTSGEWTVRFGRSVRNPLVPRAQLRTRFFSRGRSRSPGARTPMFSMNSTRWPRDASVAMISWCPCQMKSQSIVEMQMMSRSSDIRAITTEDAEVAEGQPGAAYEIQTPRPSIHAGPAPELVHQKDVEMVRVVG